jgi:Zn-dependent metalloprotease
MRFYSFCRSHFPVAIGALALGAMAGCAGSDGSPETAAQDATLRWERFVADHPDARAVDWNALRGTPRSVFGVLSAPLAAASESGARAYLAQHADLFRLHPALADLHLARTVESVIGRHYAFEQRYAGLPVEGAEFSVHLDPSDRVVALHNGYHPGVALPSIAPALARDEAIARATDLVPPDPQAGEDLPDPAEATLVVRVAEGAATLAWRVLVPTTGPNWLVMLDAQSGALLTPPRDTNRYATGAGQVFLVNAVVATRNTSLRDNNDAASAVPPNAYMTVTLLGLAGTGYLDGPFASSANTKRRAYAADNRFIFDRSFDGFSETMGYYYLDYAQRHIQSLGFQNVNNRQQVFAVNRLKGDNSFYNKKGDITYGLGGVDDAEDAEVIWHEYGHAIQDSQVPGFGSSPEAGAMGEGFGDYWAGSLGAQLSGGFQDACIADWDSTSYSTDNPPCLRRLDTSKHYPDSVVGEVHADGEIWSGALWSIRGALGGPRADTLVLSAHFLLSPDASFNAGASALVSAATTLGYNQNEVGTIRTILQNRGFTP